MSGNAGQRWIPWHRASKPRFEFFFVNDKKLWNKIVELPVIGHTTIFTWRQRNDICRRFFLLFFLVVVAVSFLPDLNHTFTSNCRVYLTETQSVPVPMKKRRYIFSWFFFTNNARTSTFSALITRFMGPTWVPWTQVGPMLATWTLLYRTSYPGHRQERRQHGVALHQHQVDTQQQLKQDIARN